MKARFAPNEWHHERGLLFKTNDEGYNHWEINVAQVEGSRGIEMRGPFADALKLYTPLIEGTAAALAVTPETVKGNGLGDFMVARATTYIRAAYPDYADFTAWCFANSHDIMTNTAGHAAVVLNDLIDSQGEIHEDDVLEHTVRVDFPDGMMFVIAANDKGDNVALMIPSDLLREPT